MKIIFINRFFYPDHSATSQMLADLAFYLVQRGWVVEVLTSRQRYDAPGADLPKFERVNGVTIHRLSTTRYGRTNLLGRAADFLSFYIGSFIKLLSITKRGDILVAKTDPPMISVIAAAVAGMKHAKLVTWLQDLFPEVAVALNVKGITGWRYSALKNLRNWSLARANANVVLGEIMQYRVKSEIGLSSKIHIIHNWADAEGIVPLHSSENPLRCEWGLTNKFVVGYSGNMGRAHQFETILDVAERLKDRNDIIVLFIGGGAQREWIEQQSILRGLVNVLFKDYQPRDRLTQSLCVPDLHLISLNPDLEGLIVPSKFYGILAAGRPVLFVGDEQGQLSTMIRHLDCGGAVVPDDVDSAVEYILRLRASREEVEREGRNARCAFLNQFTKEHSCSKWAKLLDSVG